MAAHTLPLPPFNHYYVSRTDARYPWIHHIRKNGDQKTVCGRRLVDSRIFITYAIGRVCHQCEKGIR